MLWLSNIFFVWQLLPYCNELYTACDSDSDLGCAALQKIKYLNIIIFSILYKFYYWAAPFILQQISHYECDVAVAVSVAVDAAVSVVWLLVLLVLVLLSPHVKRFSGLPSFEFCVLPWSVFEIIDFFCSVLWSQMNDVFRLLLIFLTNIQIPPKHGYQH